MPNGRPGDHPLTDMLTHDLHPFPPEIETMLREILELAPGFPDGKRAYLDEIEWDKRMFEWCRGRNLEEGKRAMAEVLKELKENKD
jgi:hypothetical protein